MLLILVLEAVGVYFDCIFYPASMLRLCCIILRLLHCSGVLDVTLLMFTSNLTNILESDI